MPDDDPQLAVWANRLLTAVDMAAATRFPDWHRNDGLISTRTGLGFVMRREDAGQQLPAPRYFLSRPGAKEILGDADCRRVMRALRGRGIVPQGPKGAAMWDWFVPTLATWCRLYQLDLDALRAWRGAHVG